MATTTSTNGRLDAETVKASAIGRQLDILVDVAGIPRDLLDGRHHACPQCGGVDRFRLVNAETGAVFCNQCHNEKCGDFISAVQWAQGLDFTAALHRIGEYLGISSGSAAQPVDLLAEFSRRKHVKPDCLARYGTTLARRGPEDVLRIPMVDQNGAETGHQDYGLAGALAKGMTGAGSKAGLFTPGRLPRPAETVVIVEGVKDAAALAELGLFAVGTPGTVFKAAWARAFKDCRVILVPDRDQASYAHFDKVAALLDRVAGSVGRVDLPFPMTENNGKDCRDLLQQPDGEKTLRDLIDQAGAGNDRYRIKFEGISLAELDEGDYSAEWLIEKFLVTKQPAIVGGPHKTLKTLISLDMAISLATGTDFLGRFPINRPVRVIYMSGEGGAGVLQDYCRRICASKRLSMAEASGVIVCEKVPLIDQPGHAEAVQEFLTENEAEVVFIDPVYRALSGADAGNLFIMGERLDRIHEAVQSVGATPILLHHIKRNRHDPDSPPDLQDLSWAGFSEHAGQWFMLGRRVPFTPNPKGLHELELNIGGRAGQSGRWGLDIEEGLLDSEIGRYWHPDVRPWEEVAQDAKAAKRDQQRDRDEAGQREIVATLSRLPRGEGMFANAIAKSIRVGHQRCERMLEQLQAEGIVEQCEAKLAAHHNTTSPGAYRLTEEWHQE